ncbi:MAG: LysM domain-containing protein [Pseudomonadota bacterium]|nr:LysM domain-containing protein [Pseudomonadota bacterium]
MKHTFPAATRAKSASLAMPLAVLAAALATAVPAAAQQASQRPVTPAQRATAQQVASAGVPLSALSPKAPEEYTVRRGDTLWRISGMFLKSPWRWPELWGMNLSDIRNPHLIYPGQQLYLERVGDRAFLRARRTADGQEGATVRVSPRNRVEMLDATPLPTLQPHLIEPFLAEPLVVDDDTFQRAPRIVALGDRDRVLVAKGDRAYVRGPEDAPMLDAPGLPTDFRVFRTAKPLKDPITGEILGYEGQYVGQAVLVRGESEAETDDSVAARNARTRPVAAMPAAGDSDGDPEAERRARSDEPRMLPVPATVDVVSSKEEMRAGDRLLPEPPREYRNYVPHAPDLPIEARVVSVHGDSVRYAGQNQIVVINKGLRDGIENGHVLTVLSSGQQMVDKTERSRTTMQLPDERNGVAMVFRPFERVSYVLVMEISRPVQMGDKLVNPQ